MPGVADARDRLRAAIAQDPGLRDRLAAANDPEAVAAALAAAGLDVADLRAGGEAALSEQELEMTAGAGNWPTHDHMCQSVVIC